MRELLTSHLEANLSSGEADIITEYEGDVGILLNGMEEITRQWSEHADHIGLQTTATRYMAPFQRSIVSSRGHPSLIITHDQLEYLAYLSFTWTDVAILLGVSHMTLYRRRREFGLLQSTSRTPSNDELEQILVDMRRDHPDYGETMVIGHLWSLGYRVSRCRLRQCIHATDPINVALCWRGGPSVRRPYSVPGPNSLWHLGDCFLSMAIVLKL